MGALQHTVDAMRLKDRGDHMKFFKIMSICLIAGLIVGCSIRGSSIVEDMTNTIAGEQKIHAVSFPKTEEPYSPDKAAENGDVVNLHGNYSNMDRWQHFLKSLEDNQPDHVRITQYTIEGDPIFYELIFDGEEIKYTFDNSMDGYGGQGKGVQSTLCKSMEKKKQDESMRGDSHVLKGCASEEIGDTFWF